MNILTFDLEDWYQLIHRRVTGTLIPARETVLRQMEALLGLLDTCGVRATFFVLGMVAERYPRLVRRVASAGHEIASHGYSHRIVYRLSREEFRQDTAHSKDLLEQMTGAAVKGFRAPEFSINRGSLWALDVLSELGFTYDSSIFPIRHRRYGIPGFDPEPKRYGLFNGMSIVEIPLAIVVLRGLHLPVAGGGYLRLLPFPFWRAAVNRLKAEGRPLVTYFHPYEFDDKRLDTFEVVHRADMNQCFCAWRMNFHQNLGRGKSMLAKLQRLVQQFKFGACEEYLHAVKLTTNADLFPSESTAVRCIV